MSAGASSKFFGGLEYRSPFGCTLELFLKVKMSSDVCIFFPSLICKFFINSGYKILLVICIRAIFSVSGSSFYFNIF